MNGYFSYANYINLLDQNLTSIKENIETAETEIYVEKLLCSRLGIVMQDKVITFMKIVYVKAWQLGTVIIN
jgi:hypothetical protein